MTNREMNCAVTGGVECNYADNYYGDQVCVLKKS